MFERVDPKDSADEFTHEYIEVTVEEALEDLRTPGAGDFFGRIDDENDRWYIGRRHIEDRQHDPVVIDWRAPIAAPFYRATVLDSFGLKHRRRFTMADGDINAYLDEINSLLNGPPFLFGHVVVDEAQDQSAVGLRVVGRRCPSGSFTILGDLAQSTTPAGQQQWPVVAQYLGAARYEVAHLTIGYRVPEPVLRMANKLLAFTAVDTVASRSVRVEGDAPTMRVSSSHDLDTAVAEEVMIARHRHVLTGVVAPLRLHGVIAAALATHGLVAVTRMQDVQRHQIPIFTAELVKGLEFDAVVVVNPAEVFDGTPRGARLLYVAMTRAVQVLRMVGDTAFDPNSL